ncbi:MAG TPA: phage tail sheath subtilisin-like domain-containing protein [Thermoanaerobaculia bacterium]|nr:phage tail sheath subtilisin-like domain-containing protein [Thermoanaerobaculia bacterium]
MPGTPIYPGVFLEEVATGVRSIEGVATSVAAFVGTFPQGPLDRPVQVLSLADFVRVFGDPDEACAACDGVRRLFLNGGTAAYVVRVAAATAAALCGTRADGTGLFALDSVDLFNLLCLPAAADLPPAELRAVYTAAAAYCEERRAFLLIDVPETVRDAAAMAVWIGENEALRHRNAAAYFPRLRVADDSGRPRKVAASGALAGLYARSDVARGVWKAPGGTALPLRGVEEPAHALTDGESATLAALGVNGLRTVLDHGTVAWGARTLAGTDAAASDWKYVPVRRLALYLEESVYRGTEWVVYEPDAEPLWAEVRRRVGAFLHDLFRRGAFQGSTPGEAYAVRCGRDTVSQEDIDRGIVNIEVGFAPLRPAEFVVIRIGQWRGARTRPYQPIP